MADLPDEPVEYLRLAVPPGWIELKAFSDDDTASAWFDALLDETPDLVDGAGRARLQEVYRQVRAEVAPYPVDAAGALLTLLDDDRPTLWMFTVTQIAFPPSGDANIMAVVERYLESGEGRAGADPDDLVESFTSDDGRDLVAIHTTARLDERQGRLSGNIPGADPSRLGAVYAAIRLPRAPRSRSDRVAVVTGVSPTVEERTPMSLVAAQLTLSATIHSDTDGIPEGRIAVDPSGAFSRAAATHVPADQDVTA
jgi:hypothetical protein